MSEERVAARADVPPGEVRVVHCAGRSLALVNDGGTLYALDNRCTHDNGPLGEGRLRNGRVICPRHGAAFDPASGRALTLPAVGRVDTFRVRVDGDDIYVACEGDA